MRRTQNGVLGTNLESCVVGAIGARFGSTPGVCNRSHTSTLPCSICRYLTIRRLQVINNRVARLAPHWRGRLCPKPACQDEAGQFEFVLDLVSASFWIKTHFEKCKTPSELHFTFPDRERGALAASCIAKNGRQLLSKGLGETHNVTIASHFDRESAARLKKLSDTPSIEGDPKFGVLGFCKFQCPLLVLCRGARGSCLSMPLLVCVVWEVYKTRADAI